MAIKCDTTNISRGDGSRFYALARESGARCPSIEKDGIVANIGKEVHVSGQWDFICLPVIRSLRWSHTNGLRSKGLGRYRARYWITVR